MRAFLAIGALLASLAAVGYVKPTSTPAKQPLAVAQPVSKPSPRVHRPKAKRSAPKRVTRSMAQPARGMGMQRPAAVAALPSCERIKRIYNSMTLAQKIAAARSNKYSAEQRAHARRCLGL